MLQDSRGSRHVRRSQVRKIGSSIVFINHLCTGSSPSPDHSTINLGFNAKTNKRVPTLVALSIRNIALLQDSLPSTIREVVVINKPIFDTSKEERLRISGFRI